MQTRGSHFDMSVELNGVTIKFLWDKYFNGTGLKLIQDIALNGYNSLEKMNTAAYNQDPKYKPKTYLYISGGAWFAYTESPSEVANIYDQNMQAMFKTIDARVDGAFDGVYFGAPLIPYYRLLSLGRNDKLTLDQYSRMIRIADDFFGFRRTNQTVESKTSPTLKQGGIRYRTLPHRTSEVSAYYFPIVNELGAENHEGLYDDIVVHYTEPSSLIQGNILLNHMCNQRIADTTRQPLAGTSCCVKYPTKDRLWLFRVFKVCLLVSFIVAATHKFQFSGLLFKSTGLVLGVIGSVALWSYVSNETGLISKSSISFSSAEFKGLLQAWFVASIFSSYFFSKYLNKEELLEPNNQSQIFLAEWQGICVSLLLIIEYTGSRYHIETFDYEIVARVLVSLWSMVEIYKTCQRFLYYDQSSNINVKQVYISISTCLVRTLARILTLPLFLSVCVRGAFDNNSLSGSIPHSYLILATKLTFWTIVVFIVVPHCLSHNKLALKTLILAAVSLTAKIIVPANSSVQDDFWANLVMIWVSLTLFTEKPSPLPSYTLFSSTTGNTSSSLTFLELVLENNSEEIFPSFSVAAGVALFFLLFVNAVQYYFSYFVFFNKNGLNNPMPYIELHREEFDRYLTARGLHYTPVVHSVIVLITAACYIVLRLAILKNTKAVIDKGYYYYYYSACWVALGKFSYEVLELYSYVFLAASGTLHLHYLPTGIVNSSSVTRTLYFVDSAFKFPYFQWRLMEKVRKCFSMAISSGMLWTLSKSCAFVWEPQAALKQRPCALQKSVSGQHLKEERS
ncbi:uncharacterized protein SAPINGB_P002521 [Magnusiomyces paraingens]|uniref:Cas1p 10 TM acyl transferase domain-containing protein n=1 Tax=Magnusiomyces paraingens TaxID=2606893 RepID=A0A5E8BGF8_9ASCO|nr:uncharacterized protein SAPINGB_P002521 [Saprochaete ingens]VVT49941.1 unnamed protein product [Saprochaete ingens]